MAVKQVVVAKTTNLGNYENERIEITYDLKEGETVSQAVSSCRTVIAAQYQRKGAQPTVPSNGNGAY